MKKRHGSLLIAVLAIVFIFAGAAAAASSCDGCASKTVCSEAKAGGACGGSSTGALNNTATGNAGGAKAEAGKNGAAAAYAEPGANFSALNASVTMTPKSAIVKIKGEKAILEKLSADFAARFGIKGKKSADCELVNIASELWIKLNAGTEKEKIEYLESAGLKIEKKSK